MDPNPIPGTTPVCLDPDFISRTLPQKYLNILNTALDPDQETRISKKEIQRIQIERLPNYQAEGNFILKPI